MAEELVRVSEKELRQRVEKKLVEVGMIQDEASTVADVLVYADLRGVHSHGVMRAEHYTKRIQSGGMNLHASLEAVRIRPSVFLVNAQGCAGHVATKIRDSGGYR